MAGKTSVVGLDIGSSGVHAAEVSLGKSGPELVRYGGVQLPAGAVLEGEIADTDAVTGAIRTVWKQAGFKTKQVVLGVANQRVVVRQVDLPPMGPEELRSALAFQAQEHIPIPVDEAELDFQVLEQYDDQSGAPMMRALLIAAQKDMVSSHMAAASHAGLKPVKVDLCSFAVLRALAPQPLSAGTSEVLVDIGSQVTDVVVHQNGIPRFVRMIQSGGDAITEALTMREGIPLDQAEHMKRAAGQPGGASQDIVRFIANESEKFIASVRSSLDYYLAQSAAEPPQRLVLSGGGALLVGLASELGRQLQLPVVAGRPSQRIGLRDTSKQATDLANVEPLLVTAIGLALGGTK